MADHHSHGDDHGGHGTMGSHGMLLFGGDVLYLSHLPMFAGPHNFQAILEVEFDAGVQAALRADRDAGGEGMHTFLPEDFPIVELDPAGGGPSRTAMTGMVFRGHFERGGEAIATSVVARVRRILRFRELDVDAPPGSRELTYLCFGSTGQLHFMHEITARPSFDHVLVGRLVPGTAADQAGRQHGDDVPSETFGFPQPVLFRNRGDNFEERLAVGEVVEGLFFQTIGPGGSHGFVAQIETHDELYLERDELA